MSNTLNTEASKLDDISNAVGAVWLRRLSSVGGALAVMLFFFPWVLVSCGARSDLGIDASGYEMATGNYGELEGMSDLASWFGDVGSEELQADAVPLLWLVPLFGLLGLAALNGRRSGVQLSLVSGLLGMVGLLIFAIGIQMEVDELSLVGFGVRYKAGYWGSWFAFILQTGAAGLAMRHGKFEGEVVAGTHLVPLVPVTPVAKPAPGMRASPTTPTAVRELARLEFIEGPLRGQSRPVTTTDLLIGRGSACDVHVDDRTVSRVHARLRFAQGTWYIQDQGSTSGTFVNDQQIQATRLSSGDRITTGNSTFTLHHLMGHQPQ
ncbi:MAG: FHA domain-containing protein [Anaerolineales bacterium]|nr:FHA domain-containing protein [Anaerolineales bacterium]